MVGVPRSRRCTNCARKKKGCDLAQPSCGQCVKLRLECTYKERTWTFVNEKVDADEFQPAVSSTEPSAAVLQHRSLSRTALEIQVVDQFWRLYLPRDRPDTVYIGAIVRTPWKRAVQAICLQDRWVLIALQACAFMSLGRLQRNRSYVRYARQLYGRALRETNKAICDPKRAQSDGTLASCKLLGIYETFHLEEDGLPSTQGWDWQRHVDGTCRIVDLRGPEMAASEYGHDLWLDARISASSAGITQKLTPAYFSAPSWATVPWEKRDKTLRDELLDYLFEVPHVLHRQEQLFAAIAEATDDETTNIILDDGIEILEKCISLAKKLCTWERRTLAVAREARNETDLDDNPTLTLFSISKSHGFAFFHLCTLFWTASLIVHGTTYVTHSKLLPLTTCSKLPKIPCWMDPTPHAANIAHSALHFFTDEAGLWGSSTASFPFGAALHFYAATGAFQSPEMRMIKSSLDSSPKAIMVSGFLRSMAASATPEGGDPRNIVEHERMAARWFDSTTSK